jgi:murein L,D-transpeptidase YcbB/YkuD
VIQQVKEYLAAFGDYTADDTSYIFKNALIPAVKQAQKRFGLPQNGIINDALIREFNVPLRRRIETMLINLERMRWMPKQPQGNRIVVNIPEFKLHVFEDFKKVYDFDIVVGTTVNRTVIFNNILKFGVFSPYWNIPESIVRKEILPGMRRNANYLTRMNMEQTGTRNGLPVVQQKPGGSNSLGRVKFIFPNEYDIYFHDTPSKWLFQENKRAFSHGCIRVNQPQILAEYLLRDKPEWNAESIRNAMNASKEKWITLTNPVPVIITYLTAWVDNNGLLNFRDDIYEHDADMAKRLFMPSLN